MEAQIAQFLNRGMNQDISVSKASNEFAFRNHNIRITAVNDNTLLSVTNEKGPKELKVNITQNGIQRNGISIQKDSVDSFTLKAEKQVDSIVTVEITTAYESASGDSYEGYHTITASIPKGKTVSNETFINSDVTIIDAKVKIPVSDSKYLYYVDGYETPKSYPSFTYSKILGNYVGHAILDDYLILFTHSEVDSTDYIYRLEYKDDTITGIVRYYGNLELPESIETLAYYESEDIQKVYWVDGIHNPRFINIIGSTINGKDASYFDFSPKISSYPLVSITKEYDGNGIFPSGVIQYFISYYNKYGTETGVVWASDLNYISSYNRGDSPENNVNCSFVLNIDNIDTSYEYMRVYSMVRTSYNSTPVVKIVKDVAIIDSSFIVKDFNTVGEALDPTALLFLGGSKFIASTLSQKDDTIFFGDITINNVGLPSSITEYITEKINNYKSNSPFIEFGYKSITHDNNDFQLNKSSRVIKSFKGGDIYRFAIQFQDFTGTWTSPIWIGDKECRIYPNKSNDTLNLPTAKFIMDDSLYELAKTYYSNYRVLMVESDFSNRKVLAQGIVTPTVFNYDERVEGTGPYSIASWLVRPINGTAQYRHLGGLGNLVKYSEEEQKDIYYSSPTAEIQNSIEYPPITKNLSNNFYVDSSIVSLYSPDIEDNQSLFNNADLKFRIIGVVPINSSDSDTIITTNTPGIKKDAGFTKNFLKYYDPRSPEDTSNDVFIKGSIYKDFGWHTDGELKGKLNKNKTVRYIIYMWSKKGSLIGQTAEFTDAEGNPFTTTYADLKHKIIANKRISDSNKYFNTPDSYNIKPIVFDSTNIESKLLKLHNGNSVVYQGNYENLLSNRINSNGEEYSYRVFWTGATSTTTGNRPSSMGGSSSQPSDRDRDALNYVDFAQSDPVHIKYNTTPHITFELNKGVVNKSILPYMTANGESAWSLKNTYEDFEIPDNYKLAWLSDNESYIQESITGLNVGKLPYLFLGEVYRDINNEDVFGGYDANNIEGLSWIPISESTPIKDNIDVTEGDTYYQRWDCLSTYPTTNEDMNSVVDITSFMVETHVNIDGRYDKSKEFSNILNARRDNFNKINNVYSQSNNLFSYSVLDEKFTNSDNKTQVLFSLTKTPLSDIDSWTSIPATSAFNLNGLYGKLNKITSFNNTLVAFQDKAISSINFNNRTAISTESGIPIEIANSGKVNGFSIISSNIGCKNKHSICQTNSGIYFIDDLNKSLFRFNRDGVSNVSSTGMSMWFKENLTGNEYLFYDCITHDVYIVNKDNCLLYNEDLQSFTSFMDYQGMSLLFNLKGNSLALNAENTIIPYKMFGGKYNSTFNSNTYNGYSVEYKINPEPLIDKTFGNVEYLADCFDDSKVDTTFLNNNDSIKYPFDTLDVWNEYQRGTTNISSRFKYPNFERKFRVWRVDIPRDSSNNRDRIRNPWIYLKLHKNATNNCKTVFHNLIVKYYK